MSETTPLNDSTDKKDRGETASNGSLYTGKASEADQVVELVSSSDDETVFDAEELNNWNKAKTYLTWLLICFSTGPTASMMRSYVVAVIQTTTHGLGHPKGSTGSCAKRGSDCYIKFGTGEVQYTSYILYLKAIYTSIEGVLAIFMMAYADYSNYRKWLMLGSIFLYGAFATPFYWIYDTTHYSTLVKVSVLYFMMLCFSTIYEISEGSYIPVFMQARGVALKKNGQYKTGKIFARGIDASVGGLVAANIGGIIAQIIVVIIIHVKSATSYKAFWLGITIAGFVTLGLSAVCVPFVPSLKGKSFEKNLTIKAILLQPFRRLRDILKDLWQYKEAFKYCVAWVLWNIAYTNFLVVFMTLFRSTLGIGSSDAEYSVWQFINLIVACLGPLAWRYIQAKVCSQGDNKKNIKFLKISLYSMMAFGTFTNFWGCLGVNSNSKVGFKHRAEFWVFLIFFVSTSSSIRSLNRVVYSAMLPRGKENQYFGLEIMLGLCVGWSESLIIGVIQDRTGNDRMPFIPNTVLYAVALCVFLFVDVEKGMKQVGKWE